MTFALQREDPPITAFADVAFVTRHALPHPRDRAVGDFHFWGGMDYSDSGRRCQGKSDDERFALRTVVERTTSNAPVMGGRQLNDLLLVQHVFPQTAVFGRGGHSASMRDVPLFEMARRVCAGWFHRAVFERLATASQETERWPRWKSEREQVAIPGSARVP